MFIIVNDMVVGSFCAWRMEKSIPCSGYKDKALRWVPPLNTQYLQNSAKSGELRKLLCPTLLCAEYSVKLILIFNSDIAYNCFKHSSIILIDT